MKLTVTEKGKQHAEQQKKDNSRRGRTSKAKGANFERTVADKLKSAYGENFVRTPQSGGFAKRYVKANEFRGDIVPADEDVDCILHIECKNSKTWKLPEWLKQSQRDCPSGKIPCVIKHLHGTSENYITLSLDDFCNLILKENIITHLKEAVKR